MSQGPSKQRGDKLSSSPAHIGVAEFLKELIDHHSWMPWHGPANDDSGWPPQPTAEALPSQDAALITGEARIAGHRCALIVSNFSYRGGSLGVAAGDHLVSAVKRARTLRLPIVASTASGGARLQEGPRALVQMLRITSVLAEFQRARLPYLVYLRHPSLGATMATWGAMGHLTFAQPGSLLGLVGPRALSGGSGATNGQERVAEEWACHGLIDGVVAPRELRAVLGRALTILYGRAAGTDDSAANTAASAMLAGIGRVQQGPEQTLGASVLELVSESALPLAWGRSQCRATAVLCRLGHVPCVLISTVWTVQQDGQLCGSEELRLFRRAIRLADDLHLPVVSLVESAGPDASPESDLAGVCQEIARCTAELLQLPTPTVSVITGVAVGGPAIAMLPADRVLCTSHAWLSPMSPQGIARIVGASSRGRPEPVTGAGPEGLRALGIVDREIPTPAGASRQAVAAEVVLAVEQELRELMQTQTQRRLAQRTQRYLSLGSL